MRSRGEEEKIPLFTYIHQRLTDERGRGVSGQRNGGGGGEGGPTGKLTVCSVFGGDKKWHTAALLPPPWPRAVSSRRSERKRGIDCMACQP